LWIYIPGIIADTLYDRYFPIEFYPTLYCGYSIIYTYLIIKHYSHIPSEGLQLAISHGFIENYNISPRETEILALIIQGKSNKQIGDQLFISQSTVKTHISNLFNKCKVKSRYALITLLSKYSIVVE
ncbi:MAG: helix-turn-helix transcriptional regulator, partial [Calditrichaceae bacterium]|nr:helix-turn-helix transcriptional regulator [Calditrichaceae bacterium]